MFAKYAVPVLAAAIGSNAASCSISGTTTIQNSGDATPIASCKTFTGSIAIATGAAGEIALNGVKAIDGDLIATNVTQVVSLSADSLESLGTFTMNDNTILSTLSFPKLTEVSRIEWMGLPALGRLSFTSGVKKADSVHIENTFMNTLDGIDLEEVGTMFIANNLYLQEVTVQLKHITESLTLSANGDKLKASFPNLEWAYNMTFRNVSSISTPSLATLNSSLGFFGDKMESFEAANLTKVGGTLSFVGNGQLKNLSLDALEDIKGGFTIADNPKLAQNLTFDSLKSVGGALDFSGNFSGVALKNLEDVRGAFNMQSSEDISSDCSHFKSLSGGSNVIKGKYQCAGKQANPGGADKKPTATGSGSSSSSTGAAGHLDVTNAAGLGAFGVLAAMLGFF